MSVENNEAGQKTEEKQNATPIEPNEAESFARVRGWVPKEEFTGDEKVWVDADEFVRRTPLFEKIDKQSRELKEVKKTLDQLKQHHSTVKETEYKRALESLRAQKKEALTDGDPDKLIDIDEQIATVRDAQKQLEEDKRQEVVQEAQQIHPEFEAWVNKNTWYSTSKAMKAFADVRGRELAADGLDKSEVLKRVEQEVRKEFPEKFTNKNREKPGAVEGTSSKGTSRAADDDLTEIERQVMNRFVRQGVMTKEQYVAELKRSKS